MSTLGSSQIEQYRSLKPREADKHLLRYSFEVVRIGGELPITWLVFAAMLKSMIQSKVVNSEEQQNMLFQVGIVLDAIMFKGAAELLKEIT